MSWISLGSRPPAAAWNFSTPLVASLPATSMSDSDSQTLDDMRSIGSPLRTASLSAVVCPTPAPQNTIQSGRARRTWGQIAAWSLPGGV